MMLFMRGMGAPSVVDDRDLRGGPFSVAGGWIVGSKLLPRTGFVLEPVQLEI